MGEVSKIEWTDATFNPWVGCTKVSPACDHCYAEGWAKRAGSPELWQGKRRRTTAANWRLPLKLNARAMAEKRRIRVFCASLADVFDNQVPDEWRHDLFDLIDRTGMLDWQLLTKRPQNIARMLPLSVGQRNMNLWLGTTVENQAEADRRIPHLLAVPVAVRFLSCEPLLERINLPRVDFHCDLCGGTGLLARWPKGRCHVCAGRGSIPAISTDPKFGLPSTPMRTIDWVIAGGESGAGARPSHPDWFRALRNQCAASGVPFFFKQWGEWAPGCDVGDLTRQAVDFGRNGAPTFFQHIAGIVEPDESLPDLLRVGKAKAGRLLDGREHSAMPQ